MTDKELKDIKARADAATPGPWEAEGLRIWTDSEEDPRLLASLKFNDDTEREEDRANAAFIAHSRQDVPALCDEIVALRELVEVLKRDGEGAEAYQRGAEDGRKAVLGERGEGEVWTPSFTLDRMARAMQYRTDMDCDHVRMALLVAISEGRCDDPRACCALLV